MATNYATVINLYKGVPLLKNGVEVLYVYQNNAVEELAPFLYRSFTNYYYARENRQYVRVKARIQECEGCNYLAFQNNSHGSKWFFGFIDRIIYINDETTEIEFTIDPFPTYLGDTTELSHAFIVRNTVLNDVRGSYLQDDYLPSSAKVKYVKLDEFNLVVSNCSCYFACSNLSGVSYISANFANTGIKVGPLNDANLQAIQQNGGIIIGAYLMPNAWIEGQQAPIDFPIVRDLGVLTGNPLAHVDGYNYSKIKSGVYNTIILQTTQGVKTYELELFENVNKVEFAIVGLMTPCPSIFIYPKKYKNVDDNIAEGLYMKCPSIPISANAVYTNQEKIQDLLNMFPAMFNGAVAGSAFGVYGALAGMAGGALRTALQSAKNEYMTRFKPPTLAGSGEPVVAKDFSLKAQLLVSSPSDNDLHRIQSYFDYYGYNISAEEQIGGLGWQVNTRHNAYLQTGSDMLVGSEVDGILNARLNTGIKIKRTLSS